MNSFNTQIPLSLSTEQAICNHVTVQVATQITGYNAQYLRRLLRAGKLEGIRVGQAWLIDLAILNAYFYHAISADDLRYGPHKAWQPPF